MTIGNSTKGRGKTSDSSPATGSVTTPDSASNITNGDFTHFVWDKLNSIDSRLADLSEKYGRMDTRVDAMDKSIGAIDKKLSRLDKTILWAAAWVGGATTVIAFIYLLYKLAEGHLSFVWK